MRDTQRRKPVAPTERKREVMELISQGTRHQILQVILGHPDHLPTMAELDHMIPGKSRSTIEEAVEKLIDGEIVARYDVSNEEIKDAGRSARDNPNNFYSLTEQGLRTLDEFEFLRSVPILRAVYDHTEQTEKTQRHQDALRPALPESVDAALAFDEADADVPGEHTEEYQGMFAAEADETDDDAFDELFDAESS